jgi:hypothetical protein
MQGPLNVEQILSFVTSTHFMDVSGPLQGPATSIPPASIDREAGWVSQPVQELLEKTKAVPPSGELLNKTMEDRSASLMFNNSESGITEFETHSRETYT